MCGRPDSPGTGAPASATEPVSAHASASGHSRGSLAVRAGRPARTRSARVPGTPPPGTPRHAPPPRAPPRSGSRRTARTAAGPPRREALPAWEPPAQQQAAHRSARIGSYFRARTKISAGRMSISASPDRVDGEKPAAAGPDRGGTDAAVPAQHVPARWRPAAAGGARPDHGRRSGPGTQDLRAAGAWVFTGGCTRPARPPWSAPATATWS